jgi:L-lactate permease
VTSLVFAIFFWVMALIGTFSLLQLWRQPIEHWSHSMPKEWPSSERAWRAYRRGMLPALLFVVLMALSFTLPQFVLAFALLLVAVVLPLLALVTLLNRPKFLVPPAQRRERGLLQELLDRRSSESHWD